MNKIIDIVSARNTFIASLILFAIIMVFLSPRAAVNVDEQLHYPHAKKVVNWYFTGGEDKSCLETPISNLKYYGQSVDNATALINRVLNLNNEFLTRHFTGALFFWLLLLFSGLVAFQLSGSYWTSVFTVFSLMLMPRLFGQAFGNLKDIPFAAGYAASVFLIIRFLKEIPQPRWSSAIWLGVAIAFTCSVRIGGLILIAFLALFCAIYIVLKPFVPKQNVSTKPCLVRLMGQGVVIGVIAYFAGLLFWPYALQDVFSNPLESLSVMEHYKVSIRQIFNGEMLWSTQLPWYYLPKWLAISTPEFVFLGLIFYLIFFFKKIFKAFSKQLFFELFVLFALFFPLVYVIVIGSNLYSGVRQMLFVLPLLAVLSSIGMYKLIQLKKIQKIRVPLFLVLIALMLLPFKHQAATFPADYVYFNSISGGNKNAWSNFEYDYYFHGIKKSSAFLMELIDNKTVTVAVNCNLSNYFTDNENIRFQYTPYMERSSTDWDYGLFGINYVHPVLLKNDTWKSNEIVKIFYHRGNPVVVLLKRKNKDDYNGIAEIEKGNLESALELLEPAWQSDKNNVWLLAQMAKISLKQNDFKRFQRYLHSGKEIYPQYEPLFLLEAQYFFDNRDYKKAKAVLDSLTVFNHRYRAAKPLLNAVNEKLNKFDN